MYYQVATDYHFLSEQNQLIQSGMLLLLKVKWTSLQLYNGEIKLLFVY